MNIIRLLLLGAGFANSTAPMPFTSHMLPPHLRRMARKSSKSNRCVNYASQGRKHPMRGIAVPSYMNVQRH